MGRQDATILRSTRWERDVLAATLGLAVGSVVEGVVQRMSHKTIFIDIGRSCRAFMCVHHTRRVGLLEHLHIGTTLAGLRVENIEFQHEWGDISLTCHNAVIELPGGRLDLPEPGPRTDDIVNPSSTAPKKSRWLRTTGSEEHSVAQQGGAPLNAGEAAAVGGREAAEVQAPEPARLNRWLTGKRDMQLPPAAKRREEEALARAEAKKGIVLYIPIGPVSDEDTEHETESFISDAGESTISRKAPSEVPTWSIDDLLLMHMEDREALETGADRYNSVTFGKSWTNQSWTAEEMFTANERMNFALQNFGVGDGQQTPEETPDPPAPAQAGWRLHRKRGQNKINPVHLSNHALFQAMKRSWVDLLEEEASSTREVPRSNRRVCDTDTDAFTAESRDDIDTPSVTSHMDDKGGSEYGADHENCIQDISNTFAAEHMPRNRHRRQKGRGPWTSQTMADDLESVGTAAKDVESASDLTVEDKQEEAEIWSRWDKQVARWKDVQAARKKWEADQQASAQAEASISANIPAQAQDEERYTETSITEEELEESVAEIQKRLNEVPTESNDPADKILLGFQKQFRSMGQQGSSRTSSEASTRRNKWIRGARRKGAGPQDKSASAEPDGHDQNDVQSVGDVCSTDADTKVDLASTAEHRSMPVGDTVDGQYDSRRAESDAVGRTLDPAASSSTIVAEESNVVSKKMSAGWVSQQIATIESKAKTAAKRLAKQAFKKQGKAAQVEEPADSKPVKSIDEECQDNHGQLAADPASGELEHVAESTVAPVDDMTTHQNDGRQLDLDPSSKSLEAAEDVGSTAVALGDAKECQHKDVQSDPQSCENDLDHVVPDEECSGNQVSKVHFNASSSSQDDVVPDPRSSCEEKPAVVESHEAMPAEGIEGKEEHGVGKVNLVDEFAEDVEVAYVAVCDKCAAVHFVDVDIMAMGLEFTCSQVGAVCEGEEPEAQEESAPSNFSAGSSVPALPPRAQIEELTKEEKQDLFDRYVMQAQAEKLKPKDIQKGVAQLYAKELQKERYINNEIVTRKGERFIKLNLSLDPGPGCRLGGILGWRSKAGRQGLGIRKMTKEEADRVCLSNKERPHVRKATGPGGYKQGYAFENKWSQHTEGTVTGTAPKGLKR